MPAHAAAVFLALRESIMVCVAERVEQVLVDDWKEQCHDTPQSAQFDQITAFIAALHKHHAAVIRKQCVGRGIAVPTPSRPHVVVGDAEASGASSRPPLSASSSSTSTSSSSSSSSVSTTPPRSTDARSSSSQWLDDEYIALTELQGKRQRRFSVVPAPARMSSPPTTTPTAAHRMIATSPGPVSAGVCSCTPHAAAHSHGSTVASAPLELCVVGRGMTARGSSADSSAPPAPSLKRRSMSVDDEPASLCHASSASPPSPTPQCEFSGALRALVDAWTSLADTVAYVLASLNPFSRDGTPRAEFTAIGSCALQLGEWPCLAFRMVDVILSKWPSRSGCVMCLSAAALLAPMLLLQLLRAPV
jgi:hypothetical protein